MSVETYRSRIPFATRPESVHTLAQRFSRFISYFLICLDVARQRRRLLAFDENALRDIGVSCADAYQEANRSFWDIPDELKPHN